MRVKLSLLTAVTALLLGAPVAHAAPARTPPDGLGCGAYYGSVVANVARSGALSGEVNPGVLHHGFAGAEDFPGFDCP